MGFPFTDVLVLLNIAAGMIVLGFSATRSARLFRGVLGGASLLQMGTGVWVLVSADSAGGGSLIDLAGELIAGGDGGFMVGWLVTTFTCVLFLAAFFRMLPPSKRALFPGYPLHLGTVIMTAVMTLVAIPVVLGTMRVFFRGNSTGEALYLAVVYGTGYGGLFLRIDLIRSLALCSFAHRNLILDDLGTLEAKEEEWNWWAFFFGVRWYFYKGLLRQGWLMLIPYGLVLIPYRPDALLLLAMAGTRVYCGRYGNRDYLRLKSRLAATGQVDPG